MATSPLPSRFVHLGDARRTFGERVDRVGSFLLRADPPADELVEELEALGPGRGFELFTRAARGGLASVAGEAPPPAFRRFFESAEYVPAWVDFPELDRGGRLLFRGGFLAGMVLGLRSLPLGYASPAGNKPLVFSGRLEKQAARRLDETAKFVAAVCRPGGMRVGGEGYVITLKVRLIHAKVRRMLRGDPRWRDDAWGLPINQHDMAATTLLFSKVMIDGLRLLGLPVSAGDGESYMHLWRWVGRLSGVDDDLLPTGEADGWRLALVIDATQAPPDDDARALTRALLATPLERASTPAQLARARAEIAFSKTLARTLLGDARADGLGIERSPYGLAMPFFRRLVGSVDRLSRTTAYGERALEQAGAEFWAKVSEQGLAAAGYDFAPPDKLANVAA